MQEILYRGKCIETNEWVYGYLVKQFGKLKIYDDSKEDFGEWISEINPKTLSQYTGIKDIHQKKVFRGDIVKVKETIYTDCSREEIEEIREYIGEIVWFQFSWCIAEKTEHGIGYRFLWTWNIEGEEDTMEVLGSRWDNPEMKVIG